MPGTKGYQATARSVDASLKEFGFDYVDLFLIHDPLAGPGGRLDKYRALLDAKKEGKIRSVGVSN
jgi:diketogulonate reductase-like aldo/keto reductase